MPAGWHYLVRPLAALCRTGRRPSFSQSYATCPLELEAERLALEPQKLPRVRGPH